MLTGLERVLGVLAGDAVDRQPVLPIMHSALPPLFGVPLGEFFTRADVMAQVMIRGQQEFGLDGVQLSMGVTAEAEALGAMTVQPPDGAPVLKEYLLADLTRMDSLRGRDPTSGGRMPVFFQAVEKVVESIGDHTFVLPTLRGPLLAASQLRGVQEILMDMLDQPEEAEKILDLTAEVAVKLGRWLLASGAHGLALGEATCSPNFISPAFYRRFVLPRHRWVVSELKKSGWRAVGLHVCGNTSAIIEDVISTGIDFMDIDYQVPAVRASALAQGRIALRGNLDPSAVFRFGTEEVVRTQTEKLCREVRHSRWIISSGCDVPPGTPAENIAAFTHAAS